MDRAALEAAAAVADRQAHELDKMVAHFMRAPLLASAYAVRAQDARDIADAIRMLIPADAEAA